MHVTVEISYYALVADYDQPVRDLLALLREADGVRVDPGTMSTMLAGEFEAVMALLTGAMAELMARYPSVFTMKIANACEVVPGR